MLHPEAIMAVLDIFPLHGSLKVCNFNILFGSSPLTTIVTWWYAVFSIGYDLGRLFFSLFQHNHLSCTFRHLSDLRFGCIPLILLLPGTEDGVLYGFPFVVGDAVGVVPLPVWYFVGSMEIDDRLLPHNFF